MQRSLPSGRGGVVKRRRRQQRGGITVQVAVSLVFIMGFAAMSVDMGSIYVAKAELQRTADAAAMAAASNLVNSDEGDYILNARMAATEVAQMNTVLGTPSHLDPSADVVFGRSVYDPASGTFSFTAGMQPFDAVQVTVRRTEGSSDGAVKLNFARVLGMSEKNLEATATAMLVPRDLAVVIDLSGSMNYDSQTKYYNRTDGGFPNARDVWCALDGPEPSRPYIPGAEHETEYASDTGPAVGAMALWGSPLTPGSYAPGSDNGLWYIRKAQTTTNANAIQSLIGRGYNTAERNAILSGTRDNTDATHWRNRCGVIMGVASWASGKSGGFPGGDGDDVLENSEVTWMATPSYEMSWTWTNFIDFCQASSRGVFRYYYGPKTYIDFLLDQQRQYTDTNNLWATPQLPMVAIKDAVQAMVDTITEVDTLDHLSLHVFGTTARDEVQLTDALQEIPETLYGRQAAHYNPSTNIGEGIRLGIAELESSRARDNARKMMVLMSDGVPNVGEDGKSSEADGIAWAYAQAEQARDKNIPIICISVGYGVDRTVMQEIANITGGSEFYAAGNPEEYTEQLQVIFRTLGGKRPVALIE